MKVFNDMADESLMLDIDIIEKRHEQRLAKKDEEIRMILAIKEKEIMEKDKKIAFLKLDSQTHNL